MIERDLDLQTVFDDFDSEPPRNTTYIITGPRGCGKTVALSHIIDVYRGKKDWVVARLSLSNNILEQMASTLYENGNAKFHFLKAEFSFSFQGISFSVKGDNPVSSVHAYISKLLAFYKRKGIRVLVAIDDVAKNDSMVDFIRAYQGFLIDHQDVMLLLTGLYKNISKLETDRSLTFLFRAPKLLLSPLSIYAISSSYANVFGVDEKRAIELAKLTKGYAFAYQVLGDILYRNKKNNVDDTVLKEYDRKLMEWSYDIIWSELTEREKDILTMLAEGNSSNISLMNELKISKGNLAIFKKRLIQEGIINSEKRGEIQFSLPRFEQFVLFQKLLASD